MHPYQDYASGNHGRRNRGLRQRALTVDSQMKINWDDSDAKSAHANVFNVTGTREEIVFFFGKSRSTDKEQTDVQLTNRIVLSPFAAKRLLLQLNHALQDHESQYGPSGAEAQTLSQLTIPGAADGRPATPGAKKTFHIAQHLFKQIQQLYDLKIE